MKNAKKFLALSLSAAMVMSLVACGSSDSTTESTSESATTTETTETTVAETTEEETSESAWHTDFDSNTVYTGSAEIEFGSSEGGSINHNMYHGEEGKDYTDEEVYTYRNYVAGTTDLKWCPLTWETSEDSYILDLTTTGFYNFTLNETLDGWAIVPEMAAELPVDVTSEYVGQYGIEDGETGKAWKIALNENATWDNGEAINADTYIYSYKELLDPKMQNRRADSLYSGDMEIYGAKAYFYQGKTAFTAGGDTAANLIAAGTSEDDLYIDVYSFWNADDSYTDAEGNAAPQYVNITDETVYGENVGDAFSGAQLYADYFAEGADYESQGADYVGTLVSYPADASFDSVGIFKTGEYEIVMVATKEVADPDYYVPYNLSSTYLVYEPLWESLKVEGDSITTTTYGTSLETSTSYGPYKLSYFELDKKFTFVRNDNWYGYSDGNHLGQFQTDIIENEVIGEQATALMAFENGELDSVSLTAADMSKYGASDYIRYTPQSYTTKMSFNTSLEKTSERGTQIMTNEKFRQAFSLAMNRTEFAQSYTSAGQAGYGLLNYLYVYDPFTGATYRDTDGAKEAIVNLYGLTYGEDGDYDSLDEAYEAITGYDLTTAQALMAEAYDECVEEGLYTEGQTVEIEFLMYASDDTYVQMFNYLKSALESACKGTGFEGNVTLKMTVDPDYYNTNYSGGADMIFTTWGGAAYSPYSMLAQCYCDASDGSGNQMEYGFDTSAITVVMELNGVEYSASLQDWANWANNDLDVTISSTDKSSSLDVFSAYSAESKAAVFGKLEYAYLSYFTTIPLYYRNSGSLVSQKGDYAVTTYVDMVGFGAWSGLQNYTFNYSDEEWKTVVANGLTY